MGDILPMLFGPICVLLVGKAILYKSNQTTSAIISISMDLSGTVSGVLTNGYDNKRNNLFRFYRLTKCTSSKYRQC